MQRPNLIQKLADGADLSGEVLPKVPLIEIVGDSRVLIECHESVIQYGKEEICVRVKYGIVSIYGNNLELIKMTHEQLVIIGQICSLSLQRRTP